MGGGGWGELHFFSICLFLYLLSCCRYPMFLLFVGFVGGGGSPRGEMHIWICHCQQLTLLVLRVMQVLRPGGMESIQVVLKAQIVHKNALTAAILQASVCHPVREIGKGSVSSLFSIAMLYGSTVTVCAHVLRHQGVCHHSLLHSHAVWVYSYCVCSCLTSPRSLSPFSSPQPCCMGLQLLCVLMSHVTKESVTALFSTAMLYGSIVTMCHHFGFQWELSVGCSVNVFL